MSDSPSKPEVTIHQCGPSSRRCKCECATGGPCEHQWDDWDEYETENGGHVSTAVCSKCGMERMGHDLWILP